MLHQIALMNRSTVVTNDDIVKIAGALQHQVNRDYRPVWGTNAAVIPVPNGQLPPPGAWWLVVLDDMDVAGALGYHDLTPDLNPVGKVGAKTDLEYGAEVSVTCSHELLEMLGDPLINQLVEDPRTNRLYAFENCDAVEADGLGYSIDGILVSDFVTPAYFDVNREGRGESLSFRGNVREPFELATGGYLSYREIGDSEWQQETKAAPGEERVGMRPAGYPKGSRRERRVRASERSLRVSNPQETDT